MHTIELLEQTLLVARRLGYQIRQEWLGGLAGGLCEFGGKRWIFVDLSATVAEQLDQVAEVLRSDPRLERVELANSMRQLLVARRAA